MCWGVKKQQFFYDMNAKAEDDRKGKKRKRGSIIALFGLNIAFGYLAMLVAMTYSIELFICMVVGLVLGHAIFNTTAPVGESVDPCCASQVIGTSSQDTESDSSQIVKKAEASCHADTNSFENSCYCSEGAVKS